MLEAKVLLPGPSVLERIVARVRARATARLHRLLIETMTPEQRARLDKLGDDVIDVFNVVSTSMFNEATKAAKQARLRSLRDLDAAALKLRDAAIVLLNSETPDDAVRTAIFQIVDIDSLTAAIDRIGELAEPHDDTYFTELRKFSRKISYTPGLLTGLNLGAAPAGRPLLEAIEYLRVVHSRRKRTGPPPTAFAPKQWQTQLRSADGSLDLTGNRLCVFDGLRRAIRRRDLFPVKSLTPILDKEIGERDLFEPCTT